MKRIALLFIITGVLNSCSRETDLLPSEYQTKRTIRDTSRIDFFKKLLKKERQNINKQKTKKKDLEQPMLVSKDNPKKIYVHYMPWFQSKEIDGYWGQHWTMANKNPEIIKPNGQKEIASHYYPKIGPYSSSDPDLHEYHFLLMKLAGVDGVIFDWYGSINLYDYGKIKQATELFMNQLDDLGLNFSIMYEDRVAQQAFDNSIVNHISDQVISDFNYIENHYFNKTNFLKNNGNPMLFIFGPEYVLNPLEWDNIINSLKTSQLELLTIWGRKNNVGQHAKGEFLWIAPDHLIAHDYYYANYAPLSDIVIGSIYPGFKSFYEAGGWGLHHQWIISQNQGYTFNETLNYTHHESANFIQIATWNDFGEGTMIEPTDEFGYIHLETLQQYTGVNHTIDDFQVPVDLYKARKKYKDNREIQDYLDQCYIYIKQLNIEQVRLILEAIEVVYNPIT